MWRAVREHRVTTPHGVIDRHSLLVLTGEVISQLVERFSQHGLDL